MAISQPDWSFVCGCLFAYLLSCLVFLVFKFSGFWFHGAQCKGIRLCMASCEGISVDTVANVDVNIVE